VNTPATFQELTTSIEQVNQQLARRAKLAVNTSLTLRNWLIGYYIHAYQLHGADRAEYGERLLEKLSGSLGALSVRGSGRRQLYGYLSFYRAYPEIVRSPTAQSPTLTDGEPSGLEKVRPVTALSAEVDADGLLHKLSYTHFEQLVRIDDPEKRQFYQHLCVRSTWSVRELKRQIASLCYERTALSTDSGTLHEQTRAVAETEPNALDIRDPYIFEFLGLRPAEVMGESELEDSLLDKLQEFLLELGHGFCFEARQKRLLIGETYFFIDLVFYHRVLKCHVLIELKVGQFTHEHVGQLNTYVSWYADHEMTEGDSPPIGLLLCTEKDHTVVKYALAGMSNQLFVSKYLVALPSEQEIEGMLAGVFA